jgi:hypothetical protein
LYLPNKKVILADKREYPASVLGRDEIKDLAILKISAVNLPVVTLGSSEKLTPGDEVIAIGYPLDLTGSATISRGIVSAFRIDNEIGVTYIQTDASINPGSSGGAIINSMGEVVGITVMSIRVAGGQPIQGMNFAISVDSAKPIIPKLIAGESVLNPWMTYSDEDWGYSVQYPRSWTLRIQQNPPSDFIYQFVYIERENAEVIIHCFEGKSPFTQTLSEQIDWATRANISANTYSVYQELSRTNLMWQGVYEACELTTLQQYNASVPLPLTKIKELMLRKNNLYSYAVECKSDASEYDSYSSIFDSIINSFRLTD